MKRWLIGAAALAAVIAGAGYAFLNSLGMFADHPIYTTSRGAIDGYDAVAYFDSGAAVPGSEQHALVWRESRWLFESAENLAKFEADPERYAPAYGGYCAYGMASGYTANTDPHAWTIVDGRLYLNFDQEVQGEWNAARADYIAQADENWPESRPARRLRESPSHD